MKLTFNQWMKFLRFQQFCKACLFPFYMMDLINGKFKINNLNQNNDTRHQNDSNQDTKS